MFGKEEKNKKKEQEDKYQSSDPFRIMSNITGGDEGSFSSGNTGDQENQLQQNFHGSSSGPPSGVSNSNSSTSQQQQQQQQPVKKKRNLPGTPGKFNHPRVLVMFFLLKHLAIELAAGSLG